MARLENLLNEADRGRFGLFEIPFTGVVTTEDLVEATYQYFPRS